jgi:hypothetical protein
MKKTSKEKLFLLDEVKTLTNYYVDYVNLIKLPHLQSQESKTILKDIIKTTKEKIDKIKIELNI